MDGRVGGSGRNTGGQTIIRLLHCRGKASAIIRKKNLFSIKEKKNKVYPEYFHKEDSMSGTGAQPCIGAFRKHR